MLERSHSRARSASRTPSIQVLAEKLGRAHLLPFCQAAAHLRAASPGRPVTLDEVRAENQLEMIESQVRGPTRVAKDRKNALRHLGQDEVIREHKQSEAADSPVSEAVGHIVDRGTSDLEVDVIETPRPPNRRESPQSRRRSSRNAGIARTSGRSLPSTQSR